MKILYHHRTASKDGQSTHIEEMIRAFKQHGCTVEEASPAVSQSTGGSQSSPGWVGFLKRSLPRFAYELAELAYSLVAYRRLAGKIEAFRPDAIYERYNLFLLAGIWAKRKYGIPLILEVNAPMAVERQEYGGLAMPRLASWLEHYVWRHADFVLPVTEVLAKHIAAQGVDRKRIVVIPNGINFDQYRDLPTAAEVKARYGLQNRLVVGFTGFVREWDRLDRIVRWIAQSCATHNTHLLIIGDGPARAEIEACAAELGISDRVTFTGAVKREEVPRISMAFDIALQTALVPYASPLCLFEYLALGKAIVAPDQPNHHEILIDRKDSLLYDPEDPQGIEKALDTLLQDEDLRSRIATEAGTVIESKGLEWKRHAARIIGLFSRLTGAPGCQAT